MNTKRLLLVSVLSAMPLVAAAGEYAPQEFDFGQLMSPLEVTCSYGTVESVREVPLERDAAGIAALFEHSIRPETTDELVVLLDDGRTVTVLQNGLKRFGAGQRVRVIPQPRGNRVEHS